MATIKEADVERYLDSTQSPKTQWLASVVYVMPDHNRTPFRQEDTLSTCRLV